MIVKFYIDTTHLSSCKGGSGDKPFWVVGGHISMISNNSFQDESFSNWENFVVGIEFDCGKSVMIFNITLAMLSVFSHVL